MGINSKWKERSMISTKSEWKNDARIKTQTVANHLSRLQLLFTFRTLYYNIFRWFPANQSENATHELKLKLLQIICLDYNLCPLLTNFATIILSDKFGKLFPYSTHVLSDNISILWALDDSQNNFKNFYINLILIDFLWRQKHTCLSLNCYTKRFTLPLATVVFTSHHLLSLPYVEIKNEGLIFTSQITT